MQLDEPYRQVAVLGAPDAAALEATVREKLAPLFEPGDAPLWRVVAERSRYIGETDRPSDVGYRKMRPTGYAQLCVVNDESPWSPWARPIPREVLSSVEQQGLASRYSRLLASVYGDGVLHFLGFAILAPGGHVPLHRDMPHDSNKRAYSHHLHVPIAGAADGEFVLHDQRLFLPPGGVYEIDNLGWHSTTNHGTGYRVNLMLDYSPRENLAARNAPSPPDGGAPLPRD